MARLCIAAVFAVTLLISASPARSETPYVQIYFDRNWTQAFENCPGTGVLDTLYIVANEFNAFIAGIEFSVDYPDELSWIADFDTQPVTLGVTPTGFSTAWAIPQNGYSPFLVAKVLVMWVCDYCGNLDSPLCPNVHPTSGYVRAVRFPDYEFIYATVKPACICPVWGCTCPEIPVAVEKTTWGRIKGLYR